MARMHVARRWSAVWLTLLVAGASTACLTSATERKPVPIASTLRVSNDPFVASLGKEVTHLLPGVSVRTSESAGNPWNEIQRGELDLALAPANSAYFSYIENVRQGVDPRNQLRVISALHVTPFVIAVRERSGIRRVADLRGRTIARWSRYAPPSGQAAPVSTAFDPTGTSGLVLEAFGVLDAIHVVNYTSADAVARGFHDGTIDAVFGATYFSREMFARLAVEGVRLIPVEGPPVDALQQRFPFIRPALVAANTYPGQHEAVRTVGVDLLLVCRSGLSADVVYGITRGYFAALPRLSTIDDISRIELERAAVSPIPLHDGAARYYQESELGR